MRIEFGKFEKVYTKEITDIAEECLVEYLDVAYSEEELEECYVEVTLLRTNRLRAFLVEKSTGSYLPESEILLDCAFKNKVKEYLL